MKKTAACIIGFCGWTLFAGACQAQLPGMPLGGAFGGQFSRPAVSPYLNINRGGDPAINYYGLVRPQVAFNKAFQTLGDNVVALESATNQPSQTGQRSSFMTQSRYFMNNGAAPMRQGGQFTGQLGGQAQQRPATPSPRGR